MSNIYLKVTIEKKWFSQNFDFLSLKNLSLVQFLESFNSHRYHWILKLDMILFCRTAEFCHFFCWFVFSEFFFLSVCCCQYELLYVLFWYFSILISFNVLVHQVNVTEVNVSVEIELWQRSISHDWSKLNICIFDVYFYICMILLLFL